MVRFGKVLTVLLMTGFGMTGVQAETLEGAIRQAQLNNPQLASERLQTEVSREQLNEARNQRRPVVNLSASYGYQSVDTNRGFAIGIGDQPVGNAQLEATMPLYTGGAIDAGIRRAKAGIGVADANLQRVGQDLVLDVVTAYVDVLTDLETLDIRDNSVDLLRQQSQAALDRFEVGVVTRTDVAQAEARLEGARAAYAGAVAALEGSRATYTFLVGVEPNNLVAVTQPPGVPSTFEIALARAYENSPDIQALKFAEEAASEAVALARSGLRPSLELVGTAGVEETFDDNFRDTSVAALARGSVPLYEGGVVRSQLKTAKLQREQARTDLENARRQVRAGLAQAWYGRLAAERAIYASERQVAAAEIAYEGAQDELSVGVRTTLDVLDQEQQLLEARLSLVEAERDFFVATHQVLRAIGDLNFD